MSGIIAYIIAAILSVLYMFLMSIGRKDKKLRSRLLMFSFILGGSIGLIIGIVALDFGNPDSYLGCTLLTFCPAVITPIMLRLYWWGQDRWLYSYPRLFKNS